ncbi:serine dehydratase beta subunit [Paraburkholderia silvatlantica]|nr:serine dehydratase beta subunit [Paraburkholderia silvatlantica]PXW37186.1 serine dehydratase beta subunit [Paraburkholderia silvatlantica]
MTISAFDLFWRDNVPSSLHTVDPMQAALQFVDTLARHGRLLNVVRASSFSVRFGRQAKETTATAACGRASLRTSWHSVGRNAALSGIPAHLRCSDRDSAREHVDDDHWYAAVPSGEDKAAGTAVHLDTGRIHHVIGNALSRQPTVHPLAQFKTVRVGGKQLPLPLWLKTKRFVCLNDLTRHRLDLLALEHRL